MLKVLARTILDVVVAVIYKPYQLSHTLEERRGMT
jgi:hypothetical protein